MEIHVEHLVAWILDDSSNSSGNDDSKVNDPMKMTHTLKLKVVFFPKKRRLPEEKMDLRSLEGNKSLWNMMFFIYSFK